MLDRVWSIAQAVKTGPRVVIATEDERILSYAKSIGAEAVLTPTSCQNGTERAFAALESAQVDSEIIINLQGDALLTPPWVLDAMIEELAADQDVNFVTPAVELGEAEIEAFQKHKVSAPASGTTVVFDLKRDALYFSKTIIPFVRKKGFTHIYRHIGLYGYRRETLAKYVSLPPSPLEQTEGLEQIRALEHGLKIRVVIVDYKGRTHGSVDSPEDIPVVEAIIAREGELIESSTCV